MQENTLSDRVFREFQRSLESDPEISTETVRLLTDGAVEDDVLNELVEE